MNRRQFLGGTFATIAATGVGFKAIASNIIEPSAPSADEDALVRLRYVLDFMTASTDRQLAHRLDIELADGLVIRGPKIKSVDSILKNHPKINGENLELIDTVDVKGLVFITPENQVIKRAKFSYVQHMVGLNEHVLQWEINPINKVTGEMRPRPTGGDTLVLSYTINFDW